MIRLQDFNYLLFKMTWHLLGGYLMYVWCLCQKTASALKAESGWTFTRSSWINTVCHFRKMWLYTIVFIGKFCISDPTAEMLQADVYTGSDWLYWAVRDSDEARLADTKSCWGLSPQLMDSRVFFFSQSGPLVFRATPQHINLTGGDRGWTVKKKKERKTPSR